MILASCENPSPHSKNFPFFIAVKPRKNWEYLYHSKPLFTIKLFFFSIFQPKHPQSLLKQKPVTHTILVTTTGSSGSVLQNSNTYSVLASSTSGTKVSSSNSSCSSVSSGNSDLGGFSHQNDHYAPDLHASLISSQPVSF